MNAKPRTAAQVRKAVAALDIQITTVTAALEGFNAMAVALEAAGNARVDSAVGDAWNATLDALASLGAQRAEVLENRRPLTGATAELVAANID
jgi:hypothetical protein